MWPAALLLALALASPVAAAPRDELLRLVPDDVGFCLAVQDLRRHAADLGASPFLKQFRGSPVGLALAQAPEVQKLARVDQQLQTYLHVSWAHLRDDILGDAVVLAYRPGPPGKPEQEQGVLLVRARDAALLAALLDRVNEAEKRSGSRPRLEVRKYLGAEYACRVGERQVQFTYRHGPVLALSSQEEMIRRVIDLDRKGPAGPGARLAEGMRCLEAEGALACLWINPRAFEAELERKAAEARGADALILGRTLACWKALDGVSLSATLGPSEVVVKLTVRAREEELPAAARRALAGESRPSELWGRFPDNALLAVAGRADAVGLAEFVRDFLTPEARKSLSEALERQAGAVLGKDVGKEVLPFLGPDWGVCVTAPTAAEASWYPHLLGALKVRPGDTEAPVDRSLLDGLNTLAVLGVLGYNGAHPDPLTLKTQVQDKVEVRYLSGERSLPPGVQPCFALKEGYLLLASSPEEIRRFGAGPPNAAAAPSGAVPLLRSSLRELGNYLRERREPLAQRMAEKDQVSREEAGRRLNNLLCVVQLFDRLELSKHSAPGRLSLVLRVQTAQPLRREPAREVPSPALPAP